MVYIGCAKNRLSPVPGDSEYTRVITFWQPVGVALLSEMQIGLDTQFCPPLLIVQSIFMKDTIQRQPEHLDAKRVRVTIRFHISHTGAIQIALRL